MNPFDGWGNYCLIKYIFLSSFKKSFSPHIIPKTKGLEESLELQISHL